MKLGMIGLGRMGAGLAGRLKAGGHECVAYDRDRAACEAAVEAGIQTAASLQELLKELPTPRVVWVMVPAGVTGQVIEELGSLLSSGDTIIDGGNSHYRDDVERARLLAKRGIHHVDCGTSGGVFGRERGYCLMIGGDEDVVRRLYPIFKCIAPGFEASPRTPGRQGPPDDAEQGYLHCGPHGAGHFVKMIHNGIEYGLMAAYAEGLNILKNAGAGLRSQAHDAETSPLREALSYRYEFEIDRITEVWRRGSVISSWLLDLTAHVLAGDPELRHFQGRVSDSGEGRWSAQAAVDEGVPVPVLAAAIFGRFESQGGADFANRVLSAMRKEFGGHDEKNAGGGG